MKWFRGPKHKDSVVAVLVFLVLLLLSALVVTLTIEVSNVKSILNRQAILISGQQEQIDKIIAIKTAVPLNGKDGKDGTDGEDGRDSVSTHTETTILKEAPVKGEAGEKGDKGDPGSALLPVMDFETCILGFMREGDDFPRNLVKIPNCEAL